MHISPEPSRERRAQQLAKRNKPSFFVVESSPLLTEAERDDYLDAYLAAFDAIQDPGGLTHAHTRNFAACLNTGEILTYLGVGKQFLPVHFRAQAAVDAVYSRQQTDSEACANPDEVEALAAGFRGLEEQLHYARKCMLAVAIRTIAEVGGVYAVSG